MAGDAGFRPVVIITRSDAIERRRNVTIAEVTRVIGSLPSEVPIQAAEGMPADCVINTDNLHTIPKDRLRRRILALSADHLFALGRALCHSLDLEW